jgi:hypothetical protein
MIGDLEHRFALGSLAEPAGQGLASLLALTRLAGKRQRDLAAL